MRVLMFGWEFPPYISGGLGTACYGLTRALNQIGAHVTFVLPRATQTASTSRLTLHTPADPRSAAPAFADLLPPAAPATTTTAAPSTSTAPGDHPPEDRPRPAMAGNIAAPDDTNAYAQADPGLEGVRFRTVPAGLLNPYARPGHIAAEPPAPPAPPPADFPRPMGVVEAEADTVPAGHGRRRNLAPLPIPTANAAPLEERAPDLVEEVQRYAALCRDVARAEPCDVIHAHDWMSFPAGQAAAQATGRPLVVHVHSTEFDRAGQAIDERIYDIERRAMHAATRVIAVSHMTASIIEHRYGVPRSRIAVIYNGTPPASTATRHNGPTDEAQSPSGETSPTTVRLAPDERLVLFLGRLTDQKGPHYFVEAAARVLEKEPNVKFVMAGDGDRAAELIDLAARRGIGHRLLFAGFLRSDDVDRVFQTADVYVMPSVSEPFGLAALEAIRHDVPVIVSRQSGVAEVVNHALKVDPWDVEDIADKILAVLRHAPLASSLRRGAELEIRRLSWPDAARQCLRLYNDAAAR